MVQLEPIIETYGYLAVVVGTFLEGETILVVAGFLAHRGYMSLTLVVLSAFAGSLLGDQLYFFIGRVRGKPFLEKKASWRPRIEKAHGLLERHQKLLIVGFRFVYGLRTVTPFVLGTTEVRTGMFVLLNAVGAVLWAGAVGSAGYLFGAAFEAAIRDVKRYEAAAIIAIAFAGLVAWSVRFYREKRHTE